MTQADSVQEKPCSHTIEDSRNRTYTAVNTWLGNVVCTIAKNAVASTDCCANVYGPYVNRVASAATVLAEGKVRRSLTRWQEVHGSARVATITLLRADGHARRKVLGKIWRAWTAVRDLQVWFR